MNVDIRPIATTGRDAVSTNESFVDIAPSSRETVLDHPGSHVRGLPGSYR